MSSLASDRAHKSVLAAAISAGSSTGPEFKPAIIQVAESVESGAVQGALVDGRRWYVFRCAMRQEAMAEANLSYQSFTYFLPKVLVTKRHARRFVTHREWLFPRYGFVSLDISRDRWRSINGTYGVERLIMGKDGPQPVPNGIVEGFQACLDERGMFDLDAGLKPGASIRVKQGPLAGALGVLQSLDGKGRVELLLELMNGQVRAKLGRECIEAVA